MKEVKHRIMLVQMLFGDEFIIMVEWLYVHLFVWKQKGRCVIVKQILCIKLVKYWDKYTEMHGQQNV